MFLLLTSLDAESVNHWLVRFQPLIPPLAMLWLWGVYVQHCEVAHVQYSLCFGAKHRKALLPSSGIYKIAAILMLLWCLYGSLYLWCSSSEAPIHLYSDVVALAMYASVLLLVIWPYPGLHIAARYLFGSTCCRVLLPVREVLWADFLLADMMTSLAKSCLDADRAMCAMLKGHVHQVLGSVTAVRSSPTSSPRCAPLSVHSLGFYVLPFVIRFIQCLLTYQHKKALPQLLNALKYFTSIPALVLAAAEHEYHIRRVAFPFFWLWLFVQSVNSLYSYYWDVEQDWDMPWMMKPGCSHLGPLCLPALRSTHTYPAWWYAYLLVSNLVLRMTWTYRLMGNLEASNMVQLLIALLEVLRRWQWLYGRIEVELQRIHQRTAHEHQLKEESTPLD